MLFRVLGWWFGKELDRLRFPQQTVAGRQLFEEIFDLIRQGGLLGFRDVQEDEVLARSATLPWHLRPFFHEGHAIGFAGRKALSLRRRNPEAAFSTTANRAIRYLCYGYWIAIAERYHLPSWALDGPLWLKDPSHLRYRRLMINGIGFGQVLLAGRLEKKALQRLETQFSDDDLAAALHGVGRVLWFLHLGNPTALAGLLEQFPHHAERLAVGIGTAVCFTQVRRPNAIAATLDALPETLQPWLRSGVGIALRFHAINDPEAEAQVEAALTPNNARWYEAACQTSEEEQLPEAILSWHFRPLLEAEREEDEIPTRERSLGATH